MSAPCCTCCGRPLNAERAVNLELDNRIDEYHDFGGVPPSQSQGWFEFGPACAKKARARAALALLKIDGRRFAKTEDALMDRIDGIEPKP